MASRPSVRPLSPHLSIWKWRVTMFVSILHRATGTALALGAVALFLWWLLAAATGAEAYLVFYTVARGWFGILVGVGLTWVFFQHMCSGLRHLYMDGGSGYELATAKRLATLTLVGSTVLTLVTWAAILTTKGL